MADDSRGTDHPPLNFVGHAELLELTQDAILVRDVRTSAVIYWNRGAEGLYGWSRQQALDQVTHILLQTVFPVSAEAVLAALVRDGYWEGELVHTRRDGQQITVSSRQAVQRDAHGQPLAILEINTDVTERKRAEAEQVRFAAERRARELAERALDHLARLHRVTAGLAEALTRQEVATVVVEQGVAALEARSGRLSLVRPDGQGIDVVASIGYAHVLTPLPMDGHLPTNEVVRTGRAIFESNLGTVIARFPELVDTIAPLTTGALAAVPLEIEGRVIGAMTLLFEGDRPFPEDDRELLIALARQCALALERARLYELSLLIQEDLRRSRDQLAAILGGIAEGVTVQDMAGNLVYANAIAARMSGYASPDEMTRAGAAITERFALFDEAGQPLASDALPGQRVLRGEPSSEVVVQFRSLESGEWRWSILDATPVCDDQGRPQLVVNIFRDITERKRQTDATEFLAAASTILGSTLDIESNLQQLADLAVPRIADWFLADLIERDGQARRVAVGYANADDAELAETLRQRPPRISSAGGLVERILRGNGPGELIESDGLVELTHADDPERGRFLEAMRPTSWIIVPLRARGHTFGSITLATSRSGRRFAKDDFALATELATRAAPAIDSAWLYREAQEQAEHHSVLNVALRETIEERDRALTDLHQAMRTRDEFLASASHDLKNPLASIKGTAQILDRRLERSGDLDVASVRTGLRRVDAIATRAAGLVEELLDQARMQMGRPLDLDRQPTDLVELAREVSQEHQQATERHHFRLEAPEPALIGSWDPGRLARVLANLLDNAVKYSPDGGPIALRVWRDDAWAALEVTDTGIGVPLADQARIFQRFHRASNVERRIGGTGIGLASVRHILESHGGTIEVHSTEGAGATFTIRLPIAGLAAPDGANGADGPFSAE